jgi:hypothetical protein
VNKLLNDGWVVVSHGPMGAYGYGYAGGDYSFSGSDSGFAAVVVLEK